MFIAQFSYDIVWGKKSQAIEVFKKHISYAIEDLGWPEGIVLEGSIGAPESRLIEQYRFESLAALEEAWSKMDDPRLAHYVEEMAPLVVPGSHKWEVFRVRVDA